MKKVIYLFISLSFFGFATEGVTQTAYLEKRVTVQVADKALGQVLKNIAEQAGCRLAYNPEVINDNKLVSLVASAWTMRETLRTLLGDDFQFRQRDEYVVIRKLRAGERLYGGYISDKKTGQRLDSVTVYDKRSLKSATTDRYGYYEIVTREPIEQLQVARRDYTDTSYQVKSLSVTRDLDISMLPQTPPPSQPPPATPPTEANISFSSNEPISFSEQTLLQNFDMQKFIKQYAEGFRRSDALNVTDDLRRKWHWSIFPYVGNNGGLSGSVTNDYSFNATVGYSKGTRILEFGVIGNINNAHVKGIQLSSIFNISGGTMSGFQLSSIVNRADVLKGLQLSGIVNTTDYLLRGVQMSTIYNQADAGKGGVQVSGLVNSVREGHTFGQLSGISNNADTVGIQVGLVNRANHTRGIQLGLINVTDTLSGVVLGLINVVKKGYHVLEISNNDAQFFNLAYKTGTSKFYTTYMGGVHVDRPFTTDVLWGIGLGLGTSVRLSQVFQLTFDVTHQHFSIGNFNRHTNELLRFTPALNIQLSKKMGIAVAPTFNAYTLKTNSDEMLYRSRILPTWNVNERGKWMTWFGFSAALRLF